MHNVIDCIERQCCSTQEWGLGLETPNQQQDTVVGIPADLNITWRTILYFPSQHTVLDTGTSGQCKNIQGCLAVSLLSSPTPQHGCSGVCTLYHLFNNCALKTSKERKHMKLQG